MQQEINNFLNKKMTRKEFLRHSGLLLLSVFGISGVLKYLAQDNFKPPVSSTGYGRNSFGGTGIKNLPKKGL